eukprot:1656-Pelagomonas_calceolata.AAC.5
MAAASVQGGHADGLEWHCMGTDSEMKRSTKMLMRRGALCWPKRASSMTGWQNLSCLLVANKYRQCYLVAQWRTWDLQEAGQSVHHTLLCSRSTCSHVLNPSICGRLALKDKVERHETGGLAHLPAPPQVYAVGSLFAVWVTWSLARSIASVFIDVCGLAAQWGLLVSGSCGQLSVCARCACRIKTHRLRGVADQGETANLVVFATVDSVCTERTHRAGMFTCQQVLCVGQRGKSCNCLPASFLSALLS